MAKRRNIAGSSHHFFMLVVLSVSALGLMLFTYASQQKTQTQSNASGAKYPCAHKPELILDEAAGSPDSVNYKFKIRNKDTGDDCKDDTYTISVDKPKGFSASFTSKGKVIGNQITLKQNQTKWFEILIKPYYKNLDNDTYKMTVMLDHTINDGPNSKISKIIYYKID